jgi:transcriptional regulator GlxA family with amidase domain
MDTFNKVNYFLTVDNNKPRYNIYTVAETMAPIYSQEKIVHLTPDYTISGAGGPQCPDPDIIVIPGITLDPDADNNRNIGIASPDVLAWIVEMHQQQKEILSVCIGAFTLAATGLLGGKYATTHYQCVDMLSKTQPNPPYSQAKNIVGVKNVKYVDSDDHTVTAGGLTCGIAGALHIIEKFDGSIYAQKAADILVFNAEAPLPPNTLTLPYDLP